MLKNNKGFTVVELIMSFLFSSILALSLFSAIMVYRAKQVDSTIEAELIAFKSHILIDIQEDIQLRGLKTIENCPVNNEGTQSGEKIYPRCVILSFNDDTSKTLNLLTYTKEDIIHNLDGTVSRFPYNIPYIIYGDIRYDIPDAGNVYIDDDYILQTASVYDGLESGTKLYKINFNLRHSDIDTSINISIIANGSLAVPQTGGAFTQYNVGDQVNVQLDNNTIRKFRVIKNSNKFLSDVTLLYDDVYDNNLVLSSTKFNQGTNVSNNYENSLIESKIYQIELQWKHADEVRLITIEELSRILGFCPKYRGVDSQDVSLTSAPAWVTSSSYWTMSKKQLSNSDNGKKVWVVKSGSSKSLSSSLVSGTYSLRPVITIRKDYLFPVS